ncbi:unnamed protein product [Soboliphyme baturini]|uniref:ANK_REP_REGION domain-containing protein n=1 Tax=Soboliphyme baturini TaxID=241478 RepID=A0A183IVS8_9BILA|nr:unnamed protein product [Soboliphyme baturini]
MRELTKRCYSPVVDREPYAVQLSKTQRKWLLAAAKCDYQLLAKLLVDDTELANFQDFMYGYAALHWAAKQGHLQVIKLLAGTYKADVNCSDVGFYQNTSSGLNERRDVITCVKLLPPAEVPDSRDLALGWRESNSVGLVLYGLFK